VKRIPQKSLNERRIAREEAAARLLDGEDPTSPASQPAPSMMDAFSAEDQPEPAKVS